MACQRYYWRQTSSGSGNNGTYGYGISRGTTNTEGYINLPVTMRIPPSSVDYSNVFFQQYAGGTVITPTSLVLSIYSTTQSMGAVTFTTATNYLTAGAFTSVLSNTTGYIGFSAEL